MVLYIGNYLSEIAIPALSQEKAEALFLGECKGEGSATKGEEEQSSPEPGKDKYLDKKTRIKELLYECKKKEFSFDEFLRDGETTHGINFQLARTDYLAFQRLFDITAVDDLARELEACAIFGTEALEEKPKDENAEMVLKIKDLVYHCQVNRFGLERCLALGEKQSLTFALDKNNYIDLKDLVEGPMRNASSSAALNIIAREFAKYAIFAKEQEIGSFLEQCVPQYEDINNILESQVKANKDELCSLEKNISITEKIIALISSSRAIIKNLESQVKANGDELCSLEKNVSIIEKINALMRSSFDLCICGEMISEETKRAIIKDFVYLIYDLVYQSQGKPFSLAEFLMLFKKNSITFALDDYNILSLVHFFETAMRERSSPEAAEIIATQLAKYAIFPTEEADQAFVSKCTDQIGDIIKIFRSRFIALQDRMNEAKKLINEAKKLIHKESDEANSTTQEKASEDNGTAEGEPE